MKVFLIAALCLGISQAKPQYNYPAPSIQQSFGSSSFGSSGGLIGGSSGGLIGGSSGGLIGGSSGGLTSGLSGGSIGGSSFGGFSSGESSSGFITGGSGGAVGGAVVGAGGGGVQVQKHIYVHVAPPEPEEVRHHASLPAAQSTKHYKIIFIKAPSYQSYQQQILQQQAQSEEKTLVYVLVKKPDAPDDITLPAVAPTQPSKPEVYFIRYKTKSQATGGAVGVGSGAVGGVSVGSTGFLGGSSGSLGGVSGIGGSLGGGGGIGGSLGSISVSDASVASSSGSLGSVGFVGGSNGSVAPRPTYGVPV